MSEDIPDLLSRGFNEVVGFRISHWQEHEVELTLELEAKHLNRSNILHGGVSATLLDVACGLAGCYCNVEGNVRRAVTLGLFTNFVASATSGKVVAKARVQSGGFKIFFSRAELFDEKNNLLAMAQGDYRYMRGSELIGGVPLQES